MRESLRITSLAMTWKLPDHEPHHSQQRSSSGHPGQNVRFAWPPDGQDGQPSRLHSVPGCVEQSADQVQCAVRGQRHPIGSTLKYNFLLAPAERPDVILDPSTFPPVPNSFSETTRPHLSRRAIRWSIPSRAIRIK